MGKSSSSCFKIISCGADSADATDELSPPESKQSSDKRRWSFRKRSASHQVPSNTVISEPQFVGFEKGNTEAIPDTFQSLKDSSVSGKIHLVEQPNVTAPVSVAVVNSEISEPLVKVKETEPLTSAAVNSEKPHIVEHTDKAVALFSAVSDTEVIDKPITSKVTVALDEHHQENIAIIIQAAARRFLAQRELKKLKHLVKLQAAVRGHLVRRQAIGTLRCVQSIVKMQALVRAHLARQSHSLEECSEQEKHDQKVRGNSILRSNKTNSTTKKLLSNGFARQLLESTPKTKAIHISCDPMRRDSAWQWLERWMAVTSSEIGEEKELNSQGYKGREENTTSAYAELDAVADPDTSLLSGPKFCPRISRSVEGEVDSEANISGKFKFQASAIVSDQCVTFAKDDKECPQSDPKLGTNEEDFTETGSPGAESAHNNYTEYTDVISENPAHTIKCDASESVEAEGKKFDNGSKKVRNPAFAAVQARFEELSSAPKATRSNSYGNRDSTVESKLYHSQVDFKPYNFQEDSMTKSEGLNVRENSRQNPMIQVAPSECGTEISISSTLDSPDRSEADGGEIILEIGMSREENHDVKSGDDGSFDRENVKAEVEQLPASSNDLNGKFLGKIDNNLSSSVQFQPVETVKLDDQLAETVKLDNQLAETVKPEGSPGNHVTAAESNGAPSSQVTKQAKTSKSRNNIPSRKPKSKPVSKTSPSKAKNDSGEKDSIEHSSKDAKNADRRSSFGMAKSDHIDHEPRRSSSNSLPSYMQATESARAKAATGSSSLKSSPDVHDKENHLKKRHSLPIVDEKQGSSPRVQRSASQTQQINKGINTHSPHSSAERKWQR